MIDKAITFATKAHTGQFRKGTSLPYIFHPMEVGMIVARMTDDPEVIAAAVLHDTVEDCQSVSMSVIRQEFGDRIADLVCAESEDKSKTWKERKAHTLETLAEEKDASVKLIALGDKLSNLRSLYRDYNHEGESVWERFNMKDKKMQGWYYLGLCDSMKDMSGYPEYTEFCDLVNKVFEDVIADIS